MNTVLDVNKNNAFENHDLEFVRFLNKTRLCDRYRSARSQQLQHVSLVYLNSRLSNVRPVSESLQINRSHNISNIMSLQQPITDGMFFLVLLVLLSYKTIGITVLLNRCHITVNTQPILLPSNFTG